MVNKPVLVIIRDGTLVAERGTPISLLGIRWPEEHIAHQWLDPCLRAVRAAQRTGLPQPIIARSAYTGRLYAGWFVALDHRTLLVHGAVIDDSLRLVRLVRPPANWRPAHDLDVPPVWAEVEPPEWRDLNWALAFNAASRAKNGRLWAVVEKHLHPDTRPASKPPELAAPPQPR